jgi:hypothetical protein
MKINWHRLFGLFLIDFFTDSAFEVELEKDLSLKQQYLDVVIVKKQHAEKLIKLPDGLDNLTQHNLLSYKSLHEPFDAWALNELIGHYVNYRKQISPSFDELLPETQFQLYAISTRFPRKLNQQCPFQQLQPGVYEIIWGIETIRLIVLSEISEAEQNALWRLFSANPQTVMQARTQYQIRSPQMSNIIFQLFEGYQEENISMSYTVQDFQREFISSHLNEIVQWLSVDDILQMYSADMLLKKLSSDEVLKRYSVNERLKGLSFEEIKTWLEKQELSKS